jgi:hypothetical protein
VAPANVRGVRGCMNASSVACEEERPASAGLLSRGPCGARMYT